MMKKTDIRRMVAIGMFCALAYVAMVTVKVPVVLWLKYEPKDTIITLSGLVYGPLWSLVVSAIVSFIEMFTVSETGFIGFLMNVLSTVSFACTASFIYKKGKSIKAAIVGLVTGVVVMTVAMILWNYLLTPLYMHTPRGDVAAMLLPVFLPFNLVKGCINAVLTYVLYRPCVEALRRAGFAEKSKNTEKKRISIPVLIACAVVLVTCILVILALNGKI